MHPFIFGCLTASAIVMPIFAHREGIAIWLMNLADKIDRLADKIEEKQKS